MALIRRRRNVVEFLNGTMKKINTCRPCNDQIESLVVKIIQIDILQLPPMLRWVFGSGFRWLTVGHGEGVRTLLAGGIVEH